MRHLNRSLNVVAALLVMLLFATLPHALKADDAAKPPVVVELFTSQGCYSCPPAEAYLGQLSKRKDIVALEFHVDYWDDLVYGSAGKWKDPFSSPEFTQRQRTYNVNIRKTGGVYTPQMVINGKWETVGSYQNKVEAAISYSKKAAEPSLSVKIDTRGEKSLTVQINGTHSDKATVWLVEFHRAIQTRVRSGENKGKTLTSHNIVSNVLPIGEWTGQPFTVSATLPDLNPNTGCAVLVQAVPAGPILGASYCPMDKAS